MLFHGNKILTYLLCFFACIVCIKNAKSQACAGSWANERPITVDCFSGQYVGQVSGNPTGCPINPVYTGLQTNTFTFNVPVSIFSIDFRSFDGAVQCPRMEIKINGIFYPLNTGNINDFNSGSTCGGNFSAIGVTSEGYLTTTSTLSSRGRITIANVSANSVTVSTNDGNGTAFSNPFGCTTVPLNLIFFSGKALNNCKSLLQWKSGIELNVKNIELLRSVNGTLFNKVAEVSPKGDDSYYEVQTDNNVDAFFKLKVNDLDGRFEYSEIIKIKSNCDNSVYSIVPNPVNDFMEISGLQNDDKVVIKSTTGQTVLNFAASRNYNRFNLQQLNSGVYVVEIFNAKGHRAALKIIKN